MGEVYEPERFDFCIHRKKKPSQKPKLDGDVKKIKTLLPKTKSVPGTPETPPLQHLLPMPIVPADDNGKIFIHFFGFCVVQKYAASNFHVSHLVFLINHSLITFLCLLGTVYCEYPF